MNPRDLHRLGALCFLSLALGACKSRSEGKQASAQASSSARATSSAGAGGPLAGRHELEPDPAFSAEIERVAATCTYVAKRDTVSCATAQLDAFRKKVEELGPVALEGLLAEVLDGAPPAAVFAALQMHKVYERSLGPSLEKTAVPGRVVAALILALGELPPSSAQRIASAATLVASREGRLDAIAAVLERRAELRDEVLPRVMRYSRLGAFDQVQKWAASADERTALSALEAPKLMENWTDEERSRFDPWLSGLLTHPNNKVQGKAAGLLLNCGDEPSKRALAWFEAAVAGRQLTRETIFYFGHHCHPDGAKLSAELASSPLCAKVEKLLDRVAADEQSALDVRKAALQTLSGVWPKTALRRAKTLTEHADPGLGQTAYNVIRNVGNTTK